MKASFDASCAESLTLQSRLSETLMSRLETLLLRVRVTASCRATNCEGDGQGDVPAQCSSSFVVLHVKLLEKTAKKGRLPTVLGDLRGLVTKKGTSVW